MAVYKNELNYSIEDYDYIKDLRDILICGRNIPLSLSIEDNKNYILSCNFQHFLRDKEVNISLTIHFNDNELRSIQLETEQNENDRNYYDYDLEFFYMNEIKSTLFDYRNKKKKKFTLRNYRAIYNCTPIYGRYKTNGEYKIEFSSLKRIPKEEPSTEHIICFDIEVEEINFERAKSLVHNVISDYTAFLAVLLDVGFFDLDSKFVNIVYNKKVGKISPEIGTLRQRTGFMDDELKLVVKNNLNGMCHFNDILKGITDVGYIALSPISSTYMEIDNTYMETYKTGDSKNVEEAFLNHRLYKAEENFKKNSDNKLIEQEACEEIEIKIHYLNEKILIPKQLRKYFNKINELKNTSYEQYKHFRSACRLYNKSCILGYSGATIEISYLVASIEALSKTEADNTMRNFSKFCKKYCGDVDRKLIEFAYAIRSKHFHLGEFEFGEYNIDINPSANVEFVKRHKVYTEIKSILRMAIITWINTNLLSMVNVD